MANIITRLLLDASSHDKGLEKAQRSLDKYIEKNVSAGNVIQGLVGTVGKMAGAVGLAMGATEALGKALNSTQTTGDIMRGTMEGLKTSVDEFFYSLSTGNMANFISGLDDIISKSIAAYNAIDQLGNTQISYGVFSAKNQASIAESQYIAKNKFAPTNERIAAFEAWAKAIEDERKGIESVQRELIEAATSAVEARTNANIEVTLDDLLRAFEVDLLKPESRTEIKNRAERGTRNYEANAARKDWTQEQKDNLAEIQKDNIITYTMLGKYSDEELESIAEKIKQYYQLVGAVKGLGREYNETANEFNNANKAMAGFNAVKSLEGYTVYSGGNQASTTFKGNTKDVEAAKGSIAYMQQELKKLQTEYANAATDAARMAAIKAIREMEADIRMMNRSAENPLTQETPSFKQSLPDDLYKVNFKPLISQKDVTTTQDYTDSLNALANVMGAINTSSMQGAAGFLSWAASLMTATATAIESIKEIVKAKTSEGAASAGAEAAKTPVIGWLLVGGAIASALAAFASIPSFAEGGVVPGANFRDGVAARLSSGEMVINPHDQKKLYDSIRRGEMGGGGGRAIVTGEQIVLAVNNYGKRSGKGILIKS